MLTFHSAGDGASQATSRHPDSAAAPEAAAPDRAAHAAQRLNFTQMLHAPAIDDSASEADSCLAEAGNPTALQHGMAQRPVQAAAPVLAPGAPTAPQHHHQLPQKSHHGHAHPHASLLAPHRQPQPAHQRYVEAAATTHPRLGLPSSSSPNEEDSVCLPVTPVAASSASEATAGDTGLHSWQHSAVLPQHYSHASAQLAGSASSLQQFPAPARSDQAAMQHGSSTQAATPAVDDGPRTAETPRTSPPVAAPSPSALSFREKMAKAQANAERGGGVAGRPLPGENLLVVCVGTHSAFNTLPTLQVKWYSRVRM